jgi:hypothetical protein
LRFNRSETFPIESQGMKGLTMLHNRLKRLGNLRWGLAAMLLGLPLPFVIIAFLFGGCR